MPKPSIVIPATAEATNEYRLEQSNRAIEREDLKPLTLGKHESKVFKRGVALEVDRCIMTTPIDGWTPNANHTPLQKMVHAKVRAKIDKEFSPEGLAATIVFTDTVAGVREVIEYDENEQIVKPLVERLEGDRSVGGVGEEREEGTNGPDNK